MKLLNTVFFTLIFAGITYSQKTDSQDKESLVITIKPSFGFNVGADYSLVNNYSSKDTFAIYPSTVYNAPGFRLGVFADIKIQKRFTLSPKAELSFNYATIIQNNETYKLDPINLSFMFHGKFNLFIKPKDPKELNLYRKSHQFIFQFDFSILTIDM